MKHLTIYAVFFISIAETSLAGPDATANRFLTDTVSMMDWGTFRTEQWLKSTGENRATVHYSWDDNRIIIKKFEYSEVLPQDAEQECKDWINSIRLRALVSFETGEVFAGYDYSLIASLFGHNGFGRTINGVSDTESLIDLDRIIWLRLAFPGATEDGSYSERLICEGALRRTDMAITRP